MLALWTALGLTGGGLSTRFGDLLAVPATGAYCHALSSNYNLLTRPAVVAVKDGASRLIIRRETEDDLFARETE